MVRFALLRQALLYGAAQALTALPPFLMLPLLTRALSPADYGRVAIFSLALTLLNPMVGLGLGRLAPLWRFSLSRFELSQRAAAAAVAVLGSGTLFAVLFLLLGLFLPDVWGLPTGWLVLAALSHVPQALVALRLAFWQAEGRALSFGLLQLATASLNVIASLAFVLWFALGWEGRLLGHLVAISAAGAAAAVSLRHAGMFVAAPDAPSLRQALRSILPLLLYGIGIMFLSVADRLVVAQWLELDEVGLYSAAWQGAMPMILVGEVLNRSVSPWLVERLRSGDPAAFRSSWTAVAAASAIVALASAALIAILFGVAGWLLGPNFQGALAILPYLVLANACGALAGLLSTYLLAAGRSGLMSWAMATSMLLLVSILLLRRLDAIFVAQAFLAAQLLLVLLTLHLIRRTWSAAAAHAPRQRGTSDLGAT